MYPGAKRIPTPLPLTQCAAVTMTLPFGLSTTLAVHECDADDVENSAPTEEGTVVVEAEPSTRPVNPTAAPLTAARGVVAYVAAREPAARAPGA